MSNIKVIGRLIKDQKLRFLRQCMRYYDPLTFAAGYHAIEFLL